jgi:hypothetical protein
MPTLIGATALTYADWAARIKEDGKVARIINLLSQTNEVLDDMLLVEGNLPVGHKTTVRTGLPQAAWRLLNYGVPKAKSTTAQVIDTCGMLEVYSEIDKSIADLNGNTAEFRLSEDLAFLEGMNQQMASTLFYGNTAVNPERFLGLAARYPTVNPANAETANNVIDMGGTGSTNTSIWIVVWGPNTCHGIFPRGSRAGLLHEDLGERTLLDGAGGQYQGYRTHYKWDVGLSLRDWRYVVRLANIDVTQLSGGSAPDLIKALIRGLHRLPTQPVGAGTEQTSDAPDDGLTMGNTVIYCNRTVRTWLDIQATNKTNVLLRMGQFDGKPVTSFRGVPVKTCDAILNTEARLT